MPEYLHPGVYIEEQPAPQTIEGVSTSTAGMVGATKKGPSTGLPQLVTSFSDFVRRYGGHLDDSWGDKRFLAYAVEGFFNNGGQRAYIMRAVADNAVASSLTLNDGFVARLAEDTADELAARNTVKLVSLVGIDVGATLTFRESFAGIVPPQDRDVTAYDNAANTVTLDSSLDFRYTAAGCTVILDGGATVPAPDAGNASLRFEARSEGTWGDSITVDVTAVNGAVGLAEAAGVTTTLRAVDLAFDSVGPDVGEETIDLDVASFELLEDDDEVEFDNGTDAVESRIITKGASPTITWTGPMVADYSGAGSTAQRTLAIRQGAADPVVSVADTTGFANGDLARITQGANTQTVLISAIDAPNLLVTLDTATFAIERDYNPGDRFALATAGRSGSGDLDLRSSSNFYVDALVEVDDGTAKSYHLVSAVQGNRLTLDPVLNRSVEADSPVRVIEFNLTVDDGVTSETFENLSMRTDAPRYVEDVVNLRSRLITVTDQNSGRALPFNLPRTTDGSTTTLGSGADGDAPDADDFKGADNGPGQRTGIKALADIDLVSILAAPGISDPSVHQELLIQCGLLKDRFAVLDPSEGSVMGSGQSNDIQVQRSNVDSLYGAIYYPWMNIRDPLYPDDEDGRLVPPSGHVIGIYARVDNTRGVHKAPANEPIRGINSLEFKLSDREQDILNPLNINVLRDFRDSNRGIRVWGARCTTTDSAWRYIPVRRLFIFVEESLEEGLQWVVFEPNGERLWARVRRTINGFLRTLWLNGALRGVTQDEAFFVKCDRSTMSEDDIANGRLIVLVGIAPLHPAEFVIIRIGQKTLEATS